MKTRVMKISSVGREVHALSITTSFSSLICDLIFKAVNQVTLLGRVGRDPVKKGSQEHPVSTFSLATHSTYGYSTGKTQKIIIITIC
jgi:hypothetical protein